jgi:NAD(P)-dependent dehydrogenase (short-subunit alcohol dehydrogenase family)
LEGRVALVTGGTDGIGRAIALRLLAEGARVAVTGRRVEKGDELVAEVGDPARLVFVCADATVPDDAARVVSEVRQGLGPVSVLVNNVGGGTGQYGPIHELEPDAWTRNVELNLYSAVWATRAVVPDMLAARWGRILMVSSLEGKMPTLPGIGPYVASKHALIGLAKSIAFDYGSEGITCNTLCPGYVDIPTRQRGQARAAAKRAEGRYADPQENYRLLTKTGRHATLDEVAEAALLLVGERSGAITGTTLNVDGGSSPY